MFQAVKIVDLSILVTNDTPIYPGDPVPDIRVATTIENEGYNLHHLHLGSHTGTHVDAPYHICPTGQTIDESDLHLFVGTGVVIPVLGKGEGEAIGLDDVRDCLHRLAPGKIALLHTGWSRYAGEEKYFRHPYVEVDVINEMIRRGVRTFCIDALNIDAPDDTSFPVHHAIAAVNGILAENFARFEDIDFPDPLVMVFPLRIVGSDGSPVRAVAIQVDSNE